jgi:acetylornithine deacetylase
VVRAGAWPSSVPESLIAEGRAGLVPGETLGELCTAFVNVIDRAADADPWLRDNRPTVEWFSGQFEPAEVSTDSPVVQLLLQSHLAVTGEPATIEAVTYGADMRHFVNFAGIPCAMYGAGDVRVAHFTDEHVDLDELRTVTRTIANAIARFCA